MTKYVGVVSPPKTWHKDPECNCFRGESKPIEEENIPKGCTGCTHCTDTPTAPELRGRLARDD